MTDDTEQGPKRPTLEPLDEALVAYADAMSRLVNDGINDFPLVKLPEDEKGKPEHGHYLRTALHLQYLAGVLVEKAVVVESEHGASWTDIGRAAGSSKQAAHERWKTVVGGWTMLHRRHSSAHGSAHLARQLDEWYAELCPETPFAVTSVLASTDPRNVAEQQIADDHRQEALALRKRVMELQDEGRDAFNDTVGTLDPAQSAEARERWAQTQDQMAAAYERLAEVEPGLADEHRDSARSRRESATTLRTRSEVPAADGTEG
ncbi:hypothetical protein [Kitasatospora purpeofusca]|uniref:hypothetical protein n=1 Tax=Kitasatospora purpeofusca TaxID=67352 RepID=UPI003808E5B1